MAGNDHQGVFIVFEGPEGAGKSTQIRKLAAALRRRGLEPRVTREPGGTPAGDAIRGVLLDPSLEIAPLTEFLLYSASRAQHVRDVIAPALTAGQVVISDRFAAASVAYQGYGRGLELDFVAQLTRKVTAGLEPDLTILLDLDPALGLRRVARRGRKDRLEQADLAFHQRVREGFLRQAEGNARWLVLDATAPQAELADRIWQRVAQTITAAGLSLADSSLTSNSSLASKGEA